MTAREKRSKNIKHQYQQISVASEPEVATRLKTEKSNVLVKSLAFQVQRVIAEAEQAGQAWTHIGSRRWNNSITGGQGASKT